MITTEFLICFYFYSYLFYSSNHTLSRVNLNGKHTKHFKVNIEYFQFSIDYMNKTIFLYQNNSEMNVNILMDYDGNSYEIEFKGRIQAVVIFGNTIYWQEPNSAVIHVMNGKAKELDRNISVFPKWTNLTNLVVMPDTLQQPIGELYNLFIPNSQPFLNHYCLQTCMW